MNVWVVVASIPSLRPLISRMWRDYKSHRSQHQTKGSNHGTASSTDPKNRVWHRRGTSSPSNGNNLTWNGGEADPSGLFPPANSYDVTVSTRGPREPGWIPLRGIFDDGIAEMQLQNHQGIQVYREIKVSQP